MTHPAALPIDELLQSCDVTRTRRGGPGGQHRNKVETAIVLKHRPSGIVSQAAELRSQDLNRQAAIHRLRVQLALDLRKGFQGDKPPSLLWQSRNRGGKLVVNAGHGDFPALLAEALDRLAANDWDVGRTAQWLGVSTTQLVNLLKLEPRAMGQLNTARGERGLKPLK